MWVRDIVGEKKLENTKKSLTVLSTISHPERKDIRIMFYLLSGPVVCWFCGFLHCVVIFLPVVCPRFLLGSLSLSLAFFLAIGFCSSLAFCFHINFSLTDRFPHVKVASRWTLNAPAMWFCIWMWCGISSFSMVIVDSAIWFIMKAPRVLVNLFMQKK